MNVWKDEDENVFASFEYELTPLWVWEHEQAE